MSVSLDLSLFEKLLQIFYFLALFYEIEFHVVFYLTEWKLRLLIVINSLMFFLFSHNVHNLLLVNRVCIPGQMLTLAFKDIDKLQFSLFAIFSGYKVRSQLVLLPSLNGIPVPGHLVAEPPENLFLFIENVPDCLFKAIHRGKINISKE